MYITNAEFKTSPVHAIDTSQLVPGGTTADNDAALMSMILAAQSLVSNECGVETFDQQSALVETERITLNRYGDMTIRPRSAPVSAVTAIAYRMHPSQAWLPIDVSYVEVDRYGRSFDMRANPMPTIGGMPLANFNAYGAYGAFGGYIDPLAMERLRRLPITVRYTYDVGFTIAAMPTAIKTATILYTANLIKERGASSFTMPGTPSTMGGSPYDNNDILLAKSLLQPWKRVI